MEIKNLRLRNEGKGSQEGIGEEKLHVKQGSEEWRGEEERW